MLINSSSLLGEVKRRLPPPPTTPSKNFPRIKEPSIGSKMRYKKPGLIGKILPNKPGVTKYGPITNLPKVDKTDPEYIGRAEGLYQKMSNPLTSSQVPQRYPSSGQKRPA